MKYFYFLAIVTIGVAFEATVEKLTVVTRTSVAQEIYERVHLQNTQALSESQISTDPDTKRRICDSIFGSASFYLWSKIPITFEPSYDKMNEEYPAFMRVLFEETEEERKVLLIPAGSKMVYRYINPTKLVDVNLHLSQKDKDSSVFQDHLFVCLTLHSEPFARQYPTSVQFGPEVINQFVSKFAVTPEYNISDSPGEYIAGRFIFIDPYPNTENLSKYHFYGLTEEPATALYSDNDIELLYLQRRKGHEPATEENLSDEPVCKLELDDGLRVCMLVLNSTRYEGKLTFFPLDKHVDHVCSKRKISFRGEHSQGNEIDKKVYEEWMISCTAYKKHSFEKVESEYLVSQAYKHREAFVYRLNSKTNEIFIDSLSTNVRFKYQ